MIPAFRADGLLPAGVYEVASWDEFAARYGSTPRRRELLFKLRMGLDNLRAAGCQFVFLNGSFVTSKAEPNDVDGGCPLGGDWNPALDLEVLDRAFLLQSRDDREALRRRYGMDFFPASFIEAGTGKPFTAFFQSTPDGLAKGIVRLELSAL